MFSYKIIDFSLLFEWSFVSVIAVGEVGATVMGKTVVGATVAGDFVLGAAVVGANSRTTVVKDIFDGVTVVEKLLLVDLSLLSAQLSS